MEKISILNKRTFLRRSCNYTGIGLLVLGIYAGSLGISELFHNYRESKRAETVRKAIASKDILFASRLLEQYNAKDLIKPEDDVRLQLELKKQEEISRFEGILQTYNLNNAHVVLDSLTHLKLFTKGEIDSLEKRIYDLSDEGLFTSVRTTQVQDRITFAKNYLDIHQNGTYKKEVITYLLSDNFSIFLNQLNINEPSLSFADAYSQLTNLNSLLEKYPDDGIVLSEIVPIQELNTKAPIFLDKLLKISSNVNIKEGSLVKTKHIDYKETADFYGAYLKERDANVPIGSLGTVVKIYDDVILVRFDNGGKYQWMWVRTPAIVYDYPSRDVAAYKLRELIGVTYLPVVEKNLFLREIKKLNENFEYYK